MYAVVEAQITEGFQTMLRENEEQSLHLEKTVRPDFSQILTSKKQLVKKIQVYTFQHLLLSAQPAGGLSAEINQLLDNTRVRVLKKLDSDSTAAVRQFVPMKETSTQPRYSLYSESMSCLWDKEPQLGNAESPRTFQAEAAHPTSPGELPEPDSVAGPLGEHQGQAEATASEVDDASRRQWSQEDRGSAPQGDGQNGPAGSGYSQSGSETTAQSDEPDLVM
ncbi:hypothetical protein scyTo_0020359 [Scyliorhinus torazame]|uniref:Uncharacterized protein n=1 Tax=Scyliorhinus torazame TaxID=75743 RepID=A0A401PQP2_SCYTO|nr:hypothetical protein [Scyliorhinus torazame]